MRADPKPLEDLSMWAMLQHGGQKANIQLLRELVEQWVQMTVQKTAGQRGGKDIPWETWSASRWESCVRRSLWWCLESWTDWRR